MDYFKLYAGHGHVGRIESRINRFVNGIITKGIWIANVVIVFFVQCDFYSEIDDDQTIGIMMYPYEGFLK